MIINCVHIMYIVTKLKQMFSDIISIIEYSLIICLYIGYSNYCLDAHDPSVCGRLPAIIGWANSHFNSLHFNKWLENKEHHLKWERDNH